MRDMNKPCHHSVSEDALYKEVVVIGNGPSGIITSFMLSGHVPYLKPVPADVPIDEMLRARLRCVPAGQSLYEAPLMELAEGLEGRSQNPVPLLLDNLLNPCADMGLQEEPLIEWKYDVEKQIDHIVLGKGPPGGSWHTFDPTVLTLSPSGWLCLPPHSALPGCSREQRATAGQVASYYQHYVRMMGLQRYFHCGVVVTGVSLQPAPPGEPCRTASCPLGARWCVTGYDTAEKRMFRYVCNRVVVAAGGGDRRNTLDCGVSSHAILDLSRAEDELAAVSGDELPVLVIGSGLSAADAIVSARRRRLDVVHAYKPGASALGGLSPHIYPEYCQVYKMMQDGTSGRHDNYIPMPQHALIEVTPAENTKLNPDHKLAPKRVKLLNLVSNEIKEVTVSLIFILIGSKPDLHFLPGKFDLSYIRENYCIKCAENRSDSKPGFKRKIRENKCFLKNHWYYLKSAIQSCKSRYWDYSSEINGNSDTKCVLSDCNERDEIEDGKNEMYINVKVKEMCTKCVNNPHSNGLGFGIDPKKPIDCRSNPIFIDKSTHEVINAPNGLYALGPLTGDNFVRFICGGALASVAHLWKERKEE